MPSERDCVAHLVQVSKNYELSMQEMLALGLLVARKWDRAGIAAPPDRRPSAEDAIAYDNFTQNELDEFRASASRMLLTYAVTLPRASWWYGVSQSLAAAFIYSIVLVVVGLTVKLFGSDLITVLRLLIGPS